METISLYSMYDKKSERFDTPFFSIDDVNAKRKFVMAIHDNKTLISQFKNDFQLHKLGTFNVLTGKLNDLQDEVIVLEGNQIVKPEDE